MKISFVNLDRPISQSKPTITQKLKQFMQFIQSCIVYKYTCIYWYVVSMYASAHIINIAHLMSRCQLNYGLLIKLCRQYADIIKEAKYSRMD